MNTSPLAYSISDACKIAGVGRTTLYGAIALGDLVARKCGRRTLILAADLEAFLNRLPIAGEQPEAKSGDS